MKRKLKIAIVILTTSVASCSLLRHAQADQQPAPEKHQQRIWHI